MVMSGPFPYPGSKVLLGDWIIEHFPDHEVYVEPFGGSAALLANKPPSWNEIFNDVDGDIVHFFRTLRDRCDELVEWLENTPFSRDLHLKYGNAFYSGYRPDDDIERAGRFFYLRNTQFGQKYTEISGFRLACKSNHAAEFQNRTERLYDFRDRLRDVQIENLDYGDLVDRTDSEETLYYFDPPYLDVERGLYTGHDAFDHSRFVDTLEAIEGRWVVSYTTLPEGLRSGYHVAEKDKRNTLRCGVDDWEKEDTERLVMNFDPDEVRPFAGVNQSGLGAFAGDSA